MARTRKVYLPLWLAWFSQLFMIPMWGYVTYLTFVAKQIDPRMWIVITLIFGGISAMLLLMGYRKLPMQVVGQDD
ncbi:MAG: hypothetical protein ACRD5W_01960 [Candidatus Acidiferrales bacterium]